MKMSRLIDAIEPPASTSNETLLRVMLANLAKSLRKSSANRDGAKERLQHWLQELAPLVKRGGVHVDDMYVAAADVFEAKIGDRHFLNTGRALTRHLDERAVSVVSDDVLSDWLGLKLSAPSPFAIQGYCKRLTDRTYVPGASVGAPGRAVWFTPFIERAQGLAEEASLMPRYDADVVTMSRYCSIAEEIRNHLGLAHVQVGASLIALVTKQTIGELVAAASAPAEAPMAPTVLEGRCHPRWRHWPPKTSSHCYGRAFELNLTGLPRQNAINQGALEGVRAPLLLDLIDRFVFLGPIGSSAADTDDQFAADIAVNDSLDVLLRRVERLASK